MSLPPSPFRNIFQRILKKLYVSSSFYPFIEFASKQNDDKSKFTSAMQMSRGDENFRLWRDREHEILSPISRDNAIWFHKNPRERLYWFKNCHGNRQVFLFLRNEFEVPHRDDFRFYSRIALILKCFSRDVRAQRL